MTRLAAWNRRAPHVAALLSTVLWALPGHAQTPSDPATARALFAEGRRLMNEKRYAEACPKFEESLRLDQGMGTQFNLAFCWEQLGKTASAWALYLDVAAAARAARQSQRELAARERAAALEPRLARLSVNVHEPAEGMEVTRDGIAIGPAAWGTAVPVDPGTHVIAASAPGKRTWSKEVRVPDEPLRLSVDVPALEDERVSPPVASAPAVATPATESGLSPRAAEMPRDSSSGSSGQRVAAWVLGGVGLAAVGVGTYFSLEFLSERDSANGICPNFPAEDCTPEETTRYYEHLGNAEDARTALYVSFAVAGGALLTSTILFLTDDGNDERAHNDVQLVPVLGDSQVGAVVSGRF